MLQMMACLTIALKYSGDNSAEHTHLSPSGLAQCKLLLYGTLVKHYSITNRLPLLPQHMTDVYTAITELLGKNTGSDVTVRFFTASPTMLSSPPKIFNNLTTCSTFSFILSPFQ